MLLIYYSNERQLCFASGFFSDYWMVFCNAIILNWFFYDIFFSEKKFKYMFFFINLDVLKKCHKVIL